MANPQTQPCVSYRRQTILLLCRLARWRAKAGGELFARLEHLQGVVPGGVEVLRGDEREYNRTEMVVL